MEAKEGEMNEEAKQGWRKVVRSLSDQADRTCAMGIWQMWWKDADEKWIKPVNYQEEE